MSGGVIGHRGPNKERALARENRRHWQTAEDHGGYREPATTTGPYPCRFKDCEFDGFTTPEALECHVEIRHGGRRQ